MNKFTLPTILLIMVIELTGCSKSNLVLVEQTPKIEVKDYRVLSEEMAMDKLLATDQSETVIEEIQQGYRKDFSWEKFWVLMNKKRALLNSQAVKKIAQLSMVECSVSNSKEFLNFIDNLYLAHHDLPAYLSGLEIHISDCAAFVSEESIKNFSYRIEELQKKVGMDRDLLFIYMRVIWYLKKNTDFIKPLNTNSVVNEYLLRTYLEDALSGEDSDLFQQAFSLFEFVHPMNKLSDYMNFSKVSLSKKSISNLVASNDLDSVIFLYEIMEKTQSGFYNENKDLLFQKVLKDGKSLPTNSAQLSKQLQGISKMLNYLFKKATTVEERVLILRQTNDFLWRLVKMNKGHIVEDALDDLSITGGLLFLAKTLVAGEVPNVNISDFGKGLDKISIDVARLIKSKSHNEGDKLSRILCRTFESVGISKSSVEEIKTENIGCKELASDEYLLGKGIFYFNFFSHYIADGKDVTLIGQSSKGGVFNLSSQKSYENQAVQVPENFKASKFVSTFLISDQSGEKTIIPFCHIYGVMDEKDLIKQLEPLKSGHNGGILRYSMETKTTSSPKVFALKSKGQVRERQVLNLEASTFIMNNSNIDEMKPEFYVLSTYENLAISKDAVKNGRFSFSYNDDLLNFYLAEILPVSRGLEEFLNHYNLSCNGEKCLAELLNKELGEAAKKNLKKKNTAIFSNSCTNPSKTFHIDEDRAKDGEDGGLKE